MRIRSKAICVAFASAIPLICAGQSPRTTSSAAGPPKFCPAHTPAKKTADAAARPIAFVAGKPIYQKDLLPQLGPRLLQLRNEKYQLEKAALDSVIRQKVIAAEAKNQGLTSAELLKREVDSKVGEPTDAEIMGYYLAVKSQINRPFADVKEQLRSTVKALKIKEARQEYADSLRAKADVMVMLQPPKVEVGYDPARVRGDPKAPITIVEFADFQCPFCGKAETTLEDLLAKYKGKVKLAYRDFPLATIHPHAETAAEASRCAEAQGKYWQMHDAMFADQAKLDEADLIKTAVSLGMNQRLFQSCLHSGRYKAAIEQDVQAGMRAGVNGTPTFFINGRFLTGAVPEAQFDSIINTELAAERPHSSLASR